VSWEIQIPFRSEDDALWEVDHSEFAAIADPREREVAAPW